MKNSNGLFIQALLCAFLIACFFGLQNMKSQDSIQTGAFGDTYERGANYTFFHLAKRLEDSL